MPFWRPVQIIPIFPLHTVLWPGLPLQLHIFEERYRRLVQDCVRADRRFGVLLIKSGQEALGELAYTHSYGTIARIKQIKRLKQGCRVVVALGEQRFILRNRIESGPYLKGEIEALAMPRLSQLNITGINDLMRMVDHYVRIVTNGKEDIKNNLMQTRTPMARLWLAAALLQIPHSRKQPLLEITNPASLLLETSRLYQKQLQLLETISQSGPHPTHPDGYSPN